MKNCIKRIGLSIQKLSLHSSFLFLMTLSVFELAYAEERSELCESITGIYPDHGERTEHLNLESLKEMVNEVRQDYFSSLNEIELEVVVKDSKNNNGAPVYLWTSFKPISLLKNRDERSYQILVSSDLFVNPPSELALKGILIHEFTHVLDYEKRRKIPLFLFLFNKIVLPSHYERDTDLKAFQLGGAPGILRYRCWQKDRLSQREYQKKIKTYYSPEEILEYLKGSNI